MVENFDDWNNLKKEIDSNELIFENFPQKSEVWMSVLGKNVGREQSGKGNKFSRPVLIVKKFNNEMFWVVPLSTKQKNLDFYHNFIDPHGKQTALILAQLKLISIKRFGRKMYTLEDRIFQSIRTKLKLFL